MVYPFFFRSMSRGDLRTILHVIILSVYNNIFIWIWLSYDVYYVDIVLVGIILCVMLTTCSVTNVQKLLR